MPLEWQLVTATRLSATVPPKPSMQAARLPEYAPLATVRSFSVKVPWELEKPPTTNTCDWPPASMVSASRPGPCTVTS